MSGLLNPQRAARLAESHARDPKAPGFGDVVVALVKKCWDGPPGEGRALAVAQAVQWLVVTRLIGLASDETADPSVRAVASHALSSIAASDRDQHPARRRRSLSPRRACLGHRAGDPPVPEPPRPHATSAHCPHRAPRATRSAAPAESQ